VEVFKLKVPWLIGLAEELPFDPWKRQVNQVAARAADPTKSKAPVIDLTIVLRWDVSDLFPDGLTPDGALPGGASLESLFTAGRYNGRRIPDVYETFDGCGVCGDTMQDRLCDPAITFLTTDEDGCPLNLGRTIRFATDDQRTVAKARDGGCTFPGCDRPGNWCDCHHVNPYGHGGPSDIATSPVSAGSTTASPIAPAGECSPPTTNGSGGKPHTATPSGPNATNNNTPDPHPHPTEGCAGPPARTNGEPKLIAMSSTCACKRRIATHRLRTADGFVAPVET